MLRILREDSGPHPGNRVRVRLVGQVRGRWVEEVRRLCNEFLDAGNVLEIEMAEVSFVDAEGLRVLRDVAAHQVSLVNCALFVAEQLRTLEQDA